MSSARTRIREGQEAWSRLKKHMSWSDWMSVGRAHIKGRTVAMGEANTNEPTGRRYNQIFGEWLTRHGFADIDKGDRSRLLPRSGSWGGRPARKLHDHSLFIGVL